MNIARSAETVARHLPDKTAIVFDARRISYAELDHAASAVAHKLTDLGLRGGDRVALFLPNIPEFVIAYLGAQKIGATVVSVNVMLTTEELDYLLRDCGATAIFTVADLWPRLEPLVGSIIDRRRVVVCEGEVPGVTSLATVVRTTTAKFPARDMAQDAPAAILYTSGTTGKQKGAVLSHLNVVSNTWTVDRYLRLTRDDTILVTLPLFHVAAQNVLMNAGLNVGATLVLHRRFDLERCVSSIVDYGVTFTLLVPTVYISILNAGVEPSALRSVRVFKSAAATMPVDIARRWQERYGRTVVEGYGLSEVSPAATYNHEFEYRFGSVGTAVDNVDVKVVDEEDRDVAAGTWGEVLIRGPNVMLGYWHRPEETALALRGGWFHTGDIAYMDEGGYLYLVDRVKDMINSAGFKIWPREVEEILYANPAIRECAVVGVPHPLKGEIAKAFVVLRPDARITEEELDAYCRQHLAAYKAPRTYAFVDQLPKNPSGKILKRILREQEAAARSAG